MMNDGVTPGTTDITADNSEDPRLLVEQLVEFAEQPELGLAGPLDLLTRLRHALAERFDGEENGGIHEETLSRTPWLCVTVRQLRQEHEELLQSLEGLAFTLRSKHGPHSLHAMRNRVSAFVESYAEHEAAEGNLIQDSCDQPAWTLE
jgi:hypothetical protein